MEQILQNLKPVAADLRPHHKNILSEYGRALYGSGFNITAEGVFTKSGEQIEYTSLESSTIRRVVEKLYLNEISNERQSLGQAQPNFEHINEGFLSNTLRGYELIKIVLDYDLIPEMDHPKHIKISQLSKEVKHHIIQFILNNYESILQYGKELNYFQDTYELIPNSQKNRFINQASVDASIDIITQMLLLPGEALIEIHLFPDSIN